MYMLYTLHCNSRSITAPQLSSGLAPGNFRGRTRVLVCIAARSAAAQRQVQQKPVQQPGSAEFMQPPGSAEAYATARLREPSPSTLRTRCPGLMKCSVVDCLKTAPCAKTVRSSEHAITSRLVVHGPHVAGADLLPPVHINVLRAAVVHCNAACAARVPDGVDALA